MKNIQGKSLDKEIEDKRFLECFQNSGGLQVKKYQVNQ